MARCLQKRATQPVLSQEREGLWGRVGARHKEGKHQEVGHVISRPRLHAPALELDLKLRLVGASAFDL